MKRGVLCVVCGLCACFFGTAGFAGEKVEIAVIPLSVFLDQGTRAVCAEVQAADSDRRFLICDDATSKDVMEALFAQGKKGGSCLVSGEVTGRSGEFDRLVVSQVRPQAPGKP